MDILDAIDTRASAVRLGDPAPTREHLNRILEMGTRAPDHGRLMPWRFVVIEGDARKKLGQAMADALRAKNPDVPEGDLEREREKARRAPTIIAVAAHVDPANPKKIAEIEQILAAGAAAQNMFLAAHGLGYGAMWKTGAAAYDPSVKAAIGLDPEDHIVAYLYIGTQVVPGRQRPAEVQNVVRYL